ncbi:multidrug resistance protein 3 [mine drainage metagenome]|uniref:Multidrug resistance protein 3 n=1 Tax=mine drainage metagenome TaxID=410659 RepID=A0A1J5Q4H9_9ZZZZ
MKHTSTDQTASDQSKILQVLSGLALGMFLSALDQTVISTASPTIATSLGHLSGQSWLITSYLGATLITTPIYGRLSDGFGRRRLFVIALSLFLIGSAMSAGATTFSFLVFGRSIQGLGAGGLFSLAFAVIADLVPPRERGRYTLFFVAIFGSASLLGPIFGGFIASAAKIFGIAGWRWIFAFNLPIGLLAIGLALRYLHVPQRLIRQRLDLAGVLSFAVFIVSLLVLSESSNSSLISSIRLWLAIAGATGLVGFILVEKRMADRAFIPLFFFRNRLFAITVFISAIAGAGMIIGLLITPLVAQVQYGVSAVTGGLLLLVTGFGNLLGSGFGSRVITKSGRYRELAIAGLVAFALGFLIFAMTLDSGFIGISFAVFLLGVGSGLVTQFASVTAPYALGDEHLGAGSSINTFARQFGSVMGAGFSLAVLFQSWKFRDGINSKLISTQNGSLRHLSSAAKASFADAARPVLLYSGVIMLVGVAIAVLLPRGVLDAGHRSASTVAD